MKSSMGALRRRDNTSRFVLSAVTRVGRSGDNDLVIDEPAVSQFHAVVTWSSPGEWELRDLGSRNGTWVGGERLKAGERKTLGHGDVIGFGDQGSWLVADASRPLPEARDITTGVRQIGTAHLLSLQSDDASADILEEARGRWVMESGGIMRDVRSGEVLAVGNQHFKIWLPLPLPQTEEPGKEAPPSVREDVFVDAKLIFFVSADLETVGLRVESSAGAWESTKAYNRALLVLAQARSRDLKRKNVATHEQGWVYNDAVNDPKMKRC